MRNAYLNRKRRSHDFSWLTRRVGGDISCIPVLSSRATDVGRTSMKRMILALVALVVLAAVVAFPQSGIVNSQGNRQDGAQRMQVVGADAVAGAPTANPVYIAGIDGTNLRGLKTDSTGNLSVTFPSSGIGDPCQSESFAKSQFFANVATATTTNLVSPSGATVVYVCGFSIYVTAGTTPTFKLVRGTGGTCGTGTADITPLYSPTATAITNSFEVLVGFGGETVAKSNASDGVCVTSAGTTPTAAV